MRPSTQLMAVVLLSAAANAASAEPLLCSLSSIRLCDESLGCAVVLHEEVNVPRFFKVDLENKTIEGTRPDGTSATTAIHSMVARLLKVSIQGVENGRSWSATISDDGSLNMVVSAEGFGFMGFGACTNP
jgi:hypothetical protein